MSDQQSSRAAAGNAYADLDFVFTQTVTTVLPADEERRHAETLWQARRRLALAVLWAEEPSRFRGLPPVPAHHRQPLPSGLVRRLIDVEQKAKRLLVEGAIDGGLERLMRSSLGDIATARELLFERNLRLVVWIARAFLGKGLDLSDLFQEGAIVLLRSVDRFDPARGTRLSTFASHAIRLGLVRALTERGRPIRVPSYRMREVIDTTKARGQLMSRLGREPSSVELGAETGVAEDAVDELLPAIRPLASVDAPIAGSGIPLGDVLADDGSRSPFRQLLKRETISRAGAVLSKLPAREQKVLSMRYGLTDEQEHTFEAIGKTLGLSRERVRQLEKSARDKMRTWLRAG